MAISKMCAELLRAKAKQVLPPQPWLWVSRPTPQLDASTLRLQRRRAQAVVIPAVRALLRDLASSAVLEHFKALLLWADHRGSDVQLRTGLVLDGSAQVAPYSAFAWRWSAVQQYHWRAEQHINVLELTALLNYLRMRTGTGLCKNGAVIRWQPFGVSYLLGATALSCRNPISVTGAELNMCDVLFPFPWRSCWGSATFTPSSVGGTWWARCMLAFYVSFVKVRFCPSK